MKLVKQALILLGKFVCKFFFCLRHTRMQRVKERERDDGRKGTKFLIFIDGLFLAVACLLAQRLSNLCPALELFSVIAIKKSRSLLLVEQ